ncbi:UvrD-helicase domain-containing protein [Halalkalibacter alkaliphilus]|uniref:DNA 3'-5' helicase n=1 Tax=Halalkalibacter alkaliphilus TaxID=2917993 RepID=A0A9X2CUS8_9BACI|nr:UvrD-helicase domain-containing protein [Halalkalibacter alkaliphilus]MCL7748755.1 UvrD-helicase domain-containing protein [Halalkalibacter alkaliphilus]
MTNREIVDQLERDKISKELTTNFLVEAGAGSGKTHSLVERMVNLITSNTFKIQQIVAITFTRKAADELKERFQTGLEKKRKATEDPLVKQRVEDALADFDQCYLGTVHAFCARLLRERPIEAGLDFDFSEIDEREDKQLADEAWERYIRDVRLKQKEKIDELSDLGFHIAELRNTLHYLREYGDVKWHFDVVEKPDLAPAFAELKKFIEHTKRSLPEEEPEKGYDTLQKKIRKTVRQLKYSDVEKEKNIVTMLRPYEKKSAVVLNRWKDSAEAKEIRDETQLLLVEVVQSTLERWFEYCHSKLIPFLKPALAYYQHLKKERSALNFQDLLVNTAKLLKENSEVRSYFQQKYGCLLVDEFQDTDPIQAEIMLYLTGVELTETNWTKITPKQGSLFVVGDPKQSIYRFRRADIDIYQRVKEMIAETGGEVLHLTMNFRTITAITEPLNGVFEGPLPQEETSYQAAFRPLHSYHVGEKDEEALKGVYQHIVPYSKKTAEVIEADSSAIARFIRASIDNKKAQPKDFMVLTRYNSNLKDYAAELEEYGIPVVTTGEISLAKDEEIQALVHVIRLLTEPSNSLYMAAVLRGPLFGISDRLLYEFVTNKGNLTLFQNVPEPLQEQDKLLLEQAYSRLKTYYTWSRDDLPSAAIEKIMHDIGLLSVYIGLRKGRRDYTRLYQVMERLRTFEANGNSEFHLVAERLVEMVQDEAIGEMTLPNEQNAVRVMNVHKSKGLEAPIVFLTQPNKFINTEKKIRQHIKRQGIESIGYFSFANDKDEQMAQPVDWNNYRREEYEYLQAEELRLLYVAATRAKQMLVVSGMEKNNEKNNPWNMLLTGMDLESLTIPENIEQPKPINHEKTDVEQFKAVQAELESWIPPLKVPTYSQYSPTDDTKELPYDVEREKGGGKAWGSVIHEVFESVLKGKELSEDEIEAILFKEELPEKRLQEVKSTIESFKSSDLFQRIQQADTSFAEMPFSFCVNNGHPLYPENGQGDVYITGIIDLVFKEEEQWVIVDFKTDRVQAEEDLNKLATHYTPQLQLYKQAWEYMTNEQVKETSLYFVTPDKTMKLNVY